MSSAWNKCYRDNAVSIKVSLCSSYDKCLIVQKKPSAWICNLTDALFLFATKKCLHCGVTVP